ncbi:hypothetical protein [Luteolibacter soli]|uniref:Uncharacterized protein n=1 Tax=Luteolibacter soli TaxID=3135280 RepID=A0ABU9B384_9BACT
MTDEEKLISQAQGYVELELYEDAWEAIEAAPASIRMNLPVLRMRVICAMAMQQIEMAEELARFLAPAGGPYLHLRRAHPAGAGGNPSDCRRRGTCAGTPFFGDRGPPWPTGLDN